MAGKFFHYTFAVLILCLTGIVAIPVFLFTLLVEYMKKRKW